MQKKVVWMNSINEKIVYILGIELLTRVKKENIWKLTSVKNIILNSYLNQKYSCLLISSAVIAIMILMKIINS